jgi:hypothetical protein
MLLHVIAKNLVPRAPAAPQSETACESGLLALTRTFGASGRKKTMSLVSPAGR